MNIALTRVNFRSPADSKFVVRMGIDRHNCFGTSCKDANAQMLSAVTAWANAAAPTLTKPTALTATGTMVAEPQVLFWIQADEASVPAADQEFMQYTGEPARGRARRRQGRRQGRAELHVGRKLAPTDRQLSQRRLGALRGGRAGAHFFISLSACFHLPLHPACLYA